MKVTHPYASAEAKYDFLFLKKVFDYVKDFKDKNFTENYPLYLDLLHANLKTGVEKVNYVLNLGTRFSWAIKNCTLNETKT